VSLVFGLSAVIQDFEDTKGVIRSRISKKDRQHNGQKKKYKRTNKNLQNIHIKQKIEPHYKPGLNSGAQEG
jgi:hypothetical protein